MPIDPELEELRRRADKLMADARARNRRTANRGCKKIPGLYFLDGLGFRSSTEEKDSHFHKRVQ